MNLEGRMYYCGPTAFHVIVPPKRAPVMKLLKIRDQFINIDLLESVTINSDVVTVCIAGERYLFAGREAAVLKKWFDQYAFDLMEHQTLALDRRAPDQPSIESLHSRVRARGLFRKPFVLE